MKTHKSSPPPPTSPLLKPLDDTPPPPELYARFYALAKRMFDEAPWDYLEESQVVAVERDADETDFVSVMGALGTHFAIAAYPSLVCLDSFMMINELPQHEAGDLFFELPQHQLIFGNKANLLPGERETIAASGIRFKNGKWPSAQAFVPGYFPWKTGATGMQALCTDLEQILSVFEEGTDIPFADSMDTPVLTRFQKKGVWHTALRTHKPKTHRHAIDMPEDLVAQVLSLPVHVMCLEADCYPLMTRIGKRGERSVCPRQLLLVDRASQFVYPPAMLMPEEGTTWSFTLAIPALLEQFVQLGFRPATIAFSSGMTASWGEPLCNMLGIRVDHSPCDALLECRFEMERFFARG